MRFAILFWFYKDFEVCQNRLELLKHFNPGVPIYGLYGGPQQDMNKAEDWCKSHLDDFYLCPFERPGFKWKKGDLAILDWYQARGKYLNWNSIAIVQWDLLVFDSILSILPNLKNGEMYLSGLRPLDSQTEADWTWTNTKFKGRQSEYHAFKRHLSENYGFSGVLYMCIFVFAVMPRRFFNRWIRVTQPELGFLEYTIPSYAKIFGIDMYEKDLGVQLPDNDTLPLNAESRVIAKEYILEELGKAYGWRMFHPYEEIWRY